MPTDNRFHFGTPVPVDEPFTGRTEEIATLAALMRSHLSAVSPCQWDSARSSPTRRRPTAHPSSAEFVRRTGLANNPSAEKALGAFIENELVGSRDGSYFVADRFWAAWLKQRTVGSR